MDIQNTQIENFSDSHKAGFVTLLGKPNSGKSTLMNALVGEKLSIITAKAQTTRHRIMGILSGEDYQIVYSDTPGIIEPHYELHKRMMRFVDKALEDTDVLLFVTDIAEKHDEDDAINLILTQKAKNKGLTLIILINKIDLADEQTVKDKILYWQEKLNPEEIIPLSALHGFNLDAVLERVLQYLPLSPPYFPKDTLTNQSERFFVREIIREKIFLGYAQEIPYCTEVTVLTFEDTPDIVRILTEIHVERKSQKGILIGKGGEKIKQIGIAARKDLETFFGKHVYLEQHVRVAPDWRKKSGKLSNFGY
ncbi:MAG: GTPase Era [Bernardetiaceae bacterium]|nr:GTPase Era [Bernardetiaceae bacterium]